MYMDKIREVFHKIANHLNNISLIAGEAKEELKDINLSEDLDKKENIIKSLGRIEDNVGALAGKLEELRSLLR